MNTPEKGRTASVGSGGWFGVCVEIAAQCYGYVASSEMARKDKAVIELAEDLRESHALGKLRAEADQLRTALQAVADEAGQHYEHNPISGVDRLPLGYTKILNLADAALNPPNRCGSERVTCIKCKHAKVSATEVNCQHWHHPARSMARDRRFERSPMLHVTGMEWAKRCENFSLTTSEPSALDRIREKV